MRNIEILKPLLLDKIWGGQYLKTVYDDPSKDNIGESWVVSTLEEGCLRINDNNLSKYFSLNYLVKFIDTTSHLSVQVHPDDTYAQKHKLGKGKTESWLILNSKKGAGIYLGLKAGIKKDFFLERVNASDDISQMLNFYPVSTGDFFHIPAGTIHAIGKDVTLCEVQQSSGTTFRVWDWNRAAPDGAARELHIDSAMDCIDFEQSNPSLRKNLSQISSSDILVNHKDYQVTYYSTKKNEKINLKLIKGESIILLKGTIQGEARLKKYQSAIIFKDGTYKFNMEAGTEFITVK